MNTTDTPVATVTDKTQSNQAGKQDPRFYLPQVLLHKWFILIAGLKLKQFRWWNFWRLIIHDWSKFLPVEYRVYSLRFTGRPYDKTAWKYAWLHHIHHNPHHHEHWVLNGEPVPMPEIFIKEMVIDWMAAGRSYQGNWNIQPWLNEAFQKMKLHPETIRRLQPILRDQGFRWPGIETGWEHNT